MNTKQVYNLLKQEQKSGGGGGGSGDGGGSPSEGNQGFDKHDWEGAKELTKEQEAELFDGIDDNGNFFDHRILNLKVFDVYIGKSSHFGYGWKMAPHAKIDDGYIDITFFEISSSKFLLYFPSIYFGTFQKTQKHFKAKRIILKGNNLPVQYNGELLGKRDTVDLKILPRVLKIISPRAFHT